MLDGHIRKHPAEDLDTPQRFSYLPKFLTEEEIDRLLAAPDITTLDGIRDRAVLEVMYATGLRVSEMVNLKQADVDLLAGLVAGRFGRPAEYVVAARRVAGLEVRVVHRGAADEEAARPDGAAVLEARFHFAHRDHDLVGRGLEQLARHRVEAAIDRHRGGLLAKRDSAGLEGGGRLGGASGPGGEGR